MRKLIPLEERVWSKVHKTETCWLWEGGRDSAGYGVTHVTGVVNRTQRPHRLVYQWLVGPIPDGMDLDHLCRVRHCVNPAHLEPVTRGENVRRGARTGVHITHCLRGHPMSGPNLRVYRDDRVCRACRKAVDAERWKLKQVRLRNAA